MYYECPLPVVSSGGLPLPVAQNVAPPWINRTFQMHIPMKVLLHQNLKSRFIF